MDQTAENLSKSKDLTLDEKEASTRRRTSVTFAIVAAVVLLIGVLSAPGLQRKMKEGSIHSIQKGVLADLDLVTRHEKAFFEKYGTYTTDLRAMGVFPKIVLYKFGFVRPGTGPAVAMEGYDPSIKDLDILKKSIPASAKIDYSEATKLSEIDFDRLASFCADCTASATGFKAVAAANLDNDPVLDVWTIDEKGQVVHLIDDLGQ